MKVRIRWTDREWASIADWLVKNECDIDKHGFRGYVRQAMQISLPKDRWRDIESMGNLKSILPPHMVEARARIATRTAPPPAPEEVKIDWGSVSSEELTGELAKRLIDNAKGLIYQIVHTACSDIIKQHLAEPQSLFFDTRPFNQKHNPEPLSSEKDKKATILVVGPIAAQQNTLREVLPDVDLRFISSDERPSLITSKMLGVSATVLWTNFISHAHQDVARQSTGVVYLASGGVNNLADTIRRVAATLN